MNQERIRRVLATAVVGCGVLAAAPAEAQKGPRRAAPPGREIAEQAKAAKLDRKNASVDRFQDRQITFTPAMLRPGLTLEELEAGQVIGVLENDVAGDETGLPPGRYNIFAAKVGDQWKVYAESNGEIVKEAIRAGLVGSETAHGPKPRFKEKGWGYQTRVCLYGAFDVCLWYWDVFFDVFLEPTTASVLVGKTTKLTASVTDNGRVRTDLAEKVVWTSSNPAIASVSVTGEVKGIAPGKVTITAAYRYGQFGDTAGSAWATAEVTVSAATSTTTTTTSPVLRYPSFEFYF